MKQYIKPEIELFTCESDNIMMSSGMTGECTGHTCRCNNSPYEGCWGCPDCTGGISGNHSCGGHMMVDEEVKIGNGIFD